MQPIKHNKHLSFILLGGEKQVSWLRTQLLLQSLARVWTKILWLSYLEHNFIVLNHSYVQVQQTVMLIILGRYLHHVLRCTPLGWYFSTLMDGLKKSWVTSHQWVERDKNQFIHLSRDSFQALFPGHVEDIYNIQFKSTTVQWTQWACTTSTVHGKLYTETWTFCII